MIRVIVIEKADYLPHDHDKEMIENDINAVITKFVFYRVPVIQLREK